MHILNTEKIDYIEVNWSYAVYIVFWPLLRALHESNDWNNGASPTLKYHSGPERQLWSLACLQIQILGSAN